MLLNQSHSILYIHLQMHAQCCGLSDTVYRVLVNRQSADSVDCWPCPSCARRNSAASRSPRQQQSPRAASANPSPASGHRQRSPSAVTGNPLARGRRRGRQGTTATVSRPVTMSRSPRQHQSTRAASANPPAQSSHGSVTFVTVARGGLRLCYGGYTIRRKRRKRIVSDGSVHNANHSSARAQLQPALWYVLHTFTGTVTTDMLKDTRLYDLLRTSVYQVGSRK